MKCESVIVYYSKGKPVAYHMLVAGQARPETNNLPPGVKVAQTSFARAYARFPSLRKHWNADGTPAAASPIFSIPQHRSAVRVS